MFGKFAEKVLDILYPRSCPVCCDIVMPKGNMICPECMGKIHFVKEPACKKCGKEIYDEAVEYCRDCMKTEHYYEWGIPLMNYDKTGRKIISDFKYHNKRDNAGFIAQEIYKREYERILHMKADALVPVPLYYRKKRIRGFNQSEVLAEELSKLTGIPVLSDAVVRRKNTVPQKTLGQGQRFTNLIKAFEAGNIPAGYRRIIIVDDIYTTGSTIDACAHILKRYGVQKVFFICACIGRNN